jgi:uncharacterized protein (DUF1501 family)
VATSQPGPDLCSIVGRVHGAHLPIGAIDLSAGYSSAGHLAPHAAQIGPRSQLSALLDPATEIVGPTGSTTPYPLFAPDSQDLIALDTYHRQRAEQLRGKWADGLNRSNQRIDDLLTALTRADNLRANSSVIKDILTQGASVSLPDQLQLAVELLDQGVCQSVFTDTTLDWDTHGTTVEQNDYFNATFMALSALAANLESRSLLDDTLVVVVSEMTRTPKRNPGGGKDHWPHTSAVLIGGGTVGGQLLGATDSSLQAQEVDFQTGLPDPNGQICSMANFNAGLLERMGVDPAGWLPKAAPWRGGTV